MPHQKPERRIGVPAAGCSGTAFPEDDPVCERSVFTAAPTAGSSYDRSTRRIAERSSGDQEATMRRMSSSVSWTAIAQAR